MNNDENTLIAHRNQLSDFRIGLAFERQFRDLPAPQVHDAKALDDLHSDIVTRLRKLRLLDAKGHFQEFVPSAVHIRRYSEAPVLAENGLFAFEMWMGCDSSLASGDEGSVPAAILQNHS